MIRLTTGIAALLSAAAMAQDADTHLPGRSEYRAPLAPSAPVIDGDAGDAAWALAAWRDINVNWLGPEYAPEDFSGRYKVVWTPERIYLVAEIVDDILFDQHRDPLHLYWDDDTLEIFVDEDRSGGEHQFSHNAFAYHFSLSNRVIDFSPDGSPREYTHHARSQWKEQGDRLVWEVSIDLYPDSYVDGGDDNRPVELYAGKIIGFMVAYCDNDGSEFRENFVGSEVVQTGATDRGYIDAGIFGSLILVE